MLYKFGLIFILAIAVSSCKKDNSTTDDKPKEEVLKPVQKTVVFSFEATWDEGSGTFAKTALSDIKNNHPLEVVVLSCHQSGLGKEDVFANEVSKGFANYFSVGLLPTFIVANPTEMSAIQSGTAMYYAAGQIIERVKEEEPQVYGKPKLKLVDNQLNVKLETVFAETESATYKVGVYLTESYLTSPQTGEGRIVEQNIHHDVLRSVISSEITGDLLLSNPVKGEKKSLEWTFAMPEGVIANNCNVVVVYWRLKGGKYDIVNAEQVRI